MGLNSVNILTLKWGTLYGPHYVNRLYQGVKKNLGRDFKFYCFTDDPKGLDKAVMAKPMPPSKMPKPWQKTAWEKLNLFSDELAKRDNITGDCLFLDLDILITDNMDCFFDYMPGKFCIIHNWKLAHQIFKKREDVGNSSVFRFPGGKSGFITEKFNHEMAWAFENFHPEQAYLTYALGEKVYWPASWVKSFKRHSTYPFPFNLWLTPKLPESCKILAFHGRPHPDEAANGYDAKRIHRKTKPATWINTYWGDT